VELYNINNFYIIIIINIIKIIIKLKIKVTLKIIQIHTKLSVIHYKFESYLMKKSFMNLKICKYIENLSKHKINFFAFQYVSN